MKGDVLERRFEGRALRHDKGDDTRLYHCLCYPCPNMTDWFYWPRNSDMCLNCIQKAEGERDG